MSTKKLKYSANVKQLMSISLLLTRSEHIVRPANSITAYARDEGTNEIEVMEPAMGRAAHTNSCFITELTRALSLVYCIVTTAHDVCLSVMQAGLINHSGQQN